MSISQLTSDKGKNPSGLRLQHPLWGGVGEAGAHKAVGKQLGSWDREWYWGLIEGGEGGASLRQGVPKGAIFDFSVN